MDLQNFTLFDATFATADIKTIAGIIRVEAEIFPGLPVQLDSIIWLETGTDAIMDLAKNLDEVRDVIEKAATKLTTATATATATA